MIADLKPYTAMKNSGVPWLGAVPSHWGVKRCRYMFREVDKRSVDGSEQHLSMSQRLGLVPSDLVENRTLVSESYAGGKLCEVGNLVLNRLKAHLGVFALARHAGVISSDYTVLRAINPTGVDYFERVLRSSACRRELRIRAKGIVEGFWRLYTDELYNIRVPVPPLAEQAAIIRFLDHADQKIRRHTRAKQKLIKLLEEQKQAIIHRAVTRGLDPNVRLKPSGVEWLGDVPEHWEVKRLQQVTDPRRPIMYGIVLPGPNVDEGVYIVKGGNCEPGRLCPESLARTTFEIESRYARSRLAARDIVFAIRGGVGAAELVPSELAGANLTQDAARIAAGAGVDPRWLLHAVRAPIFRQHVKSQVVGATVRGINIRDLKRIQIVVPPTEEQIRIVGHLEDSTRDIVAASGRAQREIGLLLEYRSRLITDVVTGKLDVREAAVRLPNEAEEPAPLDEFEVEAEADADDVGADDLDVPEEAEA
jgi:type I restriction enzyme S subunit